MQSTIPLIKDGAVYRSAIIEMEYGNMAKSISHIGDFIEQTSKRNKDCAILSIHPIYPILLYQKGFS